MYIEDTINIDEDNRLVVYADEYNDSPLDWGWDVEMHEIDNYRMWRGWDKPEDTLAYAAYNFQNEVRRGAWTAEQRDRAIHLYQVLLEDTREFKVHDYRGYSQSEWATILEVGEDIGLYDTYAAWRRGDVYIVEYQKREQFTNADETREMDVWDEVDSLAGCYLSEEYTAMDVAREHFDIPNLDN